MEKIQLIDWALLLVRAAVGIIFIAHGAQKLFGAFGGSGIEGTANMVKGLGFTPGLFWAWVVALVETLGGLFLLLGVLPRTSAGFIAIIMLVAIFKVHGANGFFMKNGGIEYQFLILINCVAIMLAGAGGFSLFNRF
jgi:putative oxidoreductase